jgi:hypothetical protein
VDEKAQTKSKSKSKKKKKGKKKWDANSEAIKKQNKGIEEHYLGCHELLLLFLANHY